jgi:hypothetical protein
MLLIGLRASPGFGMHLSGSDTPVVKGDQPGRITSG